MTPVPGNRAPSEHRCVAFGKLAGFAGTRAKGSHVAIEGELRSHEYQRELTRRHPKDHSPCRLPASQSLLGDNLTTTVLSQISTMTLATGTPHPERAQYGNRPIRPISLSSHNTRAYNSLGAMWLPARYRIDTAGSGAIILLAVSIFRRPDAA